MAFKNMRYLKTKMATDWPEEEPFRDKVMRALLFFIPDSNPDYRHKFHLINEWLIEFDDEEPSREIGINDEGGPIVAGPDDKNYGFWLDTNLKYNDCDGVEISKDEFERAWKKYFNESTNNTNAI